VSAAPPIGESSWGESEMSDKITIEIDAKWARRVNSPLYWPIGALTGVSVSFAPMYLYWWGQRAETWKVLACFAVVYFVPLFYIRLGAEVIRAIRRQSGKKDRFFSPYPR
jgi:hypothetical protein